MNIYNTRKFIEEFIGIYRSEPSLWMVKSSEYHDRKLKNAAYIKLIEKLKEIDPDANRDKVVKKINNLRTSYRKELRKVTKSTRSAAGPEDLYVPSLWYFDLLRFLDDQKKTKDSNSDYSDSDNEAGDSIMYDSFAGGSPVECEPTINVVSSPVYTAAYSESSNSSNCRQPSSSTNYQSTKKMKSELSDDALVSLRGHLGDRSRDVLEKQEDRFDIFGRIVAVKMRDLGTRQRILVEKLINDSLFEAELGHLTESYKVVDTSRSTRELVKSEPLEP